MVPVTSPPIVRAADASAVPVPAEARPAATDRPAAAGMVIGIDPETGKLGMPTREQLQELSDLERLRINHSSAGLIEVHHPDGSVSVDLQGRFQEFATVRTGPDGEFIFQCVDGAEGAERALKGPLPGPTVVAPADDAPAPARAGSEER